jgi:hypothetical protein
MAGILNANAAQSFFPGSLFASNEQGVWYDPSDMATLFQDAAGTTPVTAVEQPVGLILDKSGRGNHASQSTSTARPVLSARYNLLTRTEEFDNAAWSKLNTTVTANAATAPNGTLTADKIVEDSSTSTKLVAFIDIWPLTVAATASVYLKAAGRNFAFVSRQTSDGVSVNLITGAITSALGSPTNLSAVSVGNDWWRVSFTSSGAQPASDNLHIYASQDGVWANRSYTGDGTSGIYIWGADLRVANDGVGLPVYQRVGAGTAGSSSASGSADYDTAGFPLYLKFDGTDDRLAFNPQISGGDAATIFIAPRPLTASPEMTILSNASSIGNENGQLTLVVNRSSGTGFFIRSRGTAASNIDIADAAWVSPRTAVLCQIAKISTDTNILRRNGTQVASLTSDQGTGNYSIPVFDIGSRTDGAQFLNGRLYSLIVRGAITDAATIEQTETWVNSKTRAF